MSEIAGLGATVTMNGVKLDSIPMFTFPAGSLKFERATEKEIAPGLRDVTMRFTAAWDDVVESAKLFANAVASIPEFRREYSKWRAMLARRERKRWRRYQRQKRKQ